MGLKLASTARAPKNLGSQGRLAKRGPTLMGGLTVNHQWALQPRTLDERMHLAEGARRMPSFRRVLARLREAERVEITGIVADFRSSLKEEIDAERERCACDGDCG